MVEYRINMDLFCREYGLSEQEIQQVGTTLLTELTRRNRDVSQEVFTEMVHTFCVKLKNNRMREVDVN